MTARIAGYVSRKEWGALPPKKVTPLNGRRMEGVAVHHGGAGGYDDHAKCATQVRAYQRMHLAGDRGPQNDIAYNMLLCRHGYVFEGRTFEYQGGANGTSTANRTYFSVCVLGDGDKAYSATVTEALEWVIHQARTKHNTGPRVKGHRDFYSTGCPGARLYAWTKKVDGQPIGTVPATDPTRPRLGDRGEIVVTVQRLLNVWGYNLDEDGVFGPATDAAVRSFQRQHALEVDGIVGPKTMAALNKPTAPAKPKPTPPKEIEDMNSDELRDLIREVVGEEIDARVPGHVRKQIDTEQTARTVWTTHSIVLDPRNPFGDRVTPSNMAEHGADVYHDDNGKPIPDGKGGHVRVSDVRAIEDVDQMTKETK